MVTSDPQSVPHFQARQTATQTMSTLFQPLSTLSGDVGEAIGESFTFAADKPLALDSGGEIKPLTVAWKTYGTLNAQKSNAFLLCHALTGDQYAAGSHPVTGKPGWWHTMVGPGLPIDTNRFFVICANVIGGCMGSSGPHDVDASTNKPYGLSFPVITIRDMVRAQAKLLDHLGIESLFCVAGGSMGGMQVLQWTVAYPERVFSAMPTACATRHSAQNIAFHEVGRQAVIGARSRRLRRNRRRRLQRQQIGARGPGRGRHRRCGRRCTGRRCTGRRCTGRRCASR